VHKINWAFLPPLFRNILSVFVKCWHFPARKGNKHHKSVVFFVCFEENLNNFPPEPQLRTTTYHATPPRSTPFSFSRSRKWLVVGFILAAILFLVVVVTLVIALAAQAKLSNQGKRSLRKNVRNNQTVLHFIHFLAKPWWMRSKFGS